MIKTQQEKEKLIGNPTYIKGFYQAGMELWNSAALVDIMGIALSGIIQKLTLIGA